MNKINVKLKNIEAIVPISKIDKNKIFLKNGQVVNVLRVDAINYRLKSIAERNAILEAYKYFLKGCSFDFQILIQTEKTDVKKHIDEIRKCANSEPELLDIANDYMELVKDIANVKGSISRKFYIILFSKIEEENSNVYKVMDYLKAAGNVVNLCDNNEIAKILCESYKEKYEETYKQENILSVLPNEIDTTNPMFIKLDDKYVGSLIVINYNKEMEEIFLEKILSQEIDLQISIYYEKKNTGEIIKKLTYHIGNVGADIKITGSNQSDTDLMANTYDDAKYIRRQLQIEGDEFYYIYIYISAYSDSKENLECAIQKIESVANGIGLKTRRAIFRQLDVFEANLPILNNPKSIKEYAKRNVLTSGVISTYPFVSNELCDENGILIGVNDFNKSMVRIDRFDTDKYKNSNMCVVGTSGSGKSYFVKLMAMRNRYMNISQYIIDPEREYLKMCNLLNGSIINFEEDNIINVLDIREFSKDDEIGYLQTKLLKLNTFFSLIFPNLSLEEKSLLEDAVIKCYSQKEITFDDDSLYKKNNTNFLKDKKFKESSDMPILEDLYKIVKKEKKLNRIAVLLKPYINGSMKFLNGYTNVDLSNKLVVADIYNVEEECLSIVMYIIAELFWDKIRKSRSNRKIIYLDEVWRLIDNNEDTANFVFKMFKTIRKYGGAATAITQDINDFFALCDGKYGRGILNNSSLKCIFQLEENDIKILKENINLSDEETFKIQNAKRGSCLLYAGSNHLMVKIESSKKEHECISTDRTDLLI